MTFKKWPKKCPIIHKALEAIVNGCEYTIHDGYDEKHHRIIVVEEVTDNPDDDIIWVFQAEKMHCHDDEN